ncbi:GNAT family N-acetyltransferase [Flagellimonas myxillae]|uniref:GNAT family N-acetyltransferase n=1 Tax=Flagellimonas myxillae TaxID=2942214 RepID=UPI00201F57B2|nr:GNAT family N-acetyltransferase [Muricauda myxillae]MCL6268211.1 GNAT family N-acetyltransferase [Muricauda myxillae]
MNNIDFKFINPFEYKDRVLELLKQLNPDKSVTHIESLLKEMVEIPTYRCFALFKNDDLIGISSGWTTIRVYCGKHLELDNVVIDSNIQSKGFGNYFLNAIKQWACSNAYQTIGLNTYVENTRSHKFYYNQKFKILGLHFEHNLI